MLFVDMELLHGVTPTPQAAGYQRHAGLDPASSSNE
jgi:hypothetical protein